jgi:putative acetyltransferase
LNDSSAKEEPGYSPRFGFVPAGAHGLRCKWPVPEEAYRVFEVEPGRLESKSGGLVNYSAAFDEVT